MVFLLASVHFNANVIARDGETLKVYVWLPDSALSGADTLPVPVILVRTPYDTFGIGPSYIDYLTGLGYAYVVSTFRGYWGSTGVRMPFLTDGWGTLQDGYDVASWIASRPWYNGQICTLGGSALGFAQYFLGGTGFQLTCMAPAVAGINLYDEVYPGGVFRKFIAEYWLNAVGATHMLDTIERYYIYSDTTPWFAVNGYRRLGYYSSPMLHLTGWYDAFTEGAIGGFQRLQYEGGVGAAGNQYLVVGPWMHDLTERTVGDLTFPPNASNVSVPVFVLNWILYHTRGLGWDWDTMPKVLFYLMGDVSVPDTTLFNRWVRSDTFPPRGGVPTEWYLTSDGRLAEAPEDTSTLTYTYDPEDPVPSIGGYDYIGGAIDRDSILFGPRDLSPWDGRDDVLRFSSDTLREPLIVVGAPELEVAVSTDRYDTDFMAFLADEYPDGRVILVSEGVLKLRNRNGTDREDPVSPGEIYRIRIRLRNTAYVFNTGHRVRLYITSSKFPSYEPNPNTGAPFQIDDPVRLVANNSVITGLSYLTLPTYGPELLLRERERRGEVVCRAIAGSVECGGVEPEAIYDVAGRRRNNRGLTPGVYFVRTGGRLLKVLVR
ncbi:MAG: CocE/NonD family hydrolase [Thermotogae bacterium]|nr:CocE/NonD family hydrolase [Thermotogota bacterium]